MSDKKVSLNDSKEVLQYEKDVKSFLSPQKVASVMGGRHDYDDLLACLLGAVLGAGLGFLLGGIIVKVIIRIIT